MTRCLSDILFIHLRRPIGTFMQGKSVEDIISEWDAELVKRSQSFTEHANALADWDRIILKNRQVLLDVEEHLCQVLWPYLLCSSSCSFHSLEVAGVDLRSSLCDAFLSRHQAWVLLLSCHSSHTSGPGRYCRRW